MGDIAEAAVGEGFHRRCRIVLCDVVKREIPFLDERRFGIKGLL
jgi:hypothetical protein